MTLRARFLSPRQPSTINHQRLLLLLLSLSLPGCFGEEAIGDTDAWVEDVATDAALTDVPDGPNTYGGYLPPTADERQATALSELNRARKAAGLGPVDMNEDLNEASQSHADFIVAHCEDYARSGLSPHEQDAAWAGFTGKQPWDRMKHFGYQAQMMSEVIAFENDPRAAVKGWIDTLYHRLPLLSPALIEVGYGGAVDPASTCSSWMLSQADVMDLGLASTAEEAIVLWPPDGAVVVPRSFNGYESPQPPPPPAGYPSGYIVTVQFAQSRKFQVTGHQLLEDEATPVAHLILAAEADAAQGVSADPHKDSYAPWSNLSLYALSPLKAKTKYRVVLDLVRNGLPLHLEWTFTTGIS